jgi:HAD superfamily hydrolase (TIGR01509 family)
MKLRAILFDHDGTLVNSEPVHFELWAKVLKQYGFALTEEHYRLYYAGVPTRANAIDLVERFGIKEEPWKLAHAKNVATDEYLEHAAFPLMKGVKEAVDLIHSQGLQLAVVTGASATGVRATFKAYGFEQKFSLIVSNEDVQQSKPAPDCYLLALRKLGLGPDECIAIEDTSPGLQAAHSAGLRCFVVPSEMSKHQDFRSATAVCTEMSEAIKLIRQLQS